MGRDKLTLEEAEVLLEVWGDNNFLDFSSWCQNAQAFSNFEMHEHCHQPEGAKKRKETKTFICAASLEFQNGTHGSIRANGFGKSKKEAKRDSIEKIVQGLIQAGIIDIGLRDKSFMTRQIKNTIMQSFKEENMEESGKQEKKRNKRADPIVNPMAKKITKKMKEALFENKFNEAIGLFVALGKMKAHEWNEMSFLWSYALKRGSIKEIQVVLDLFQSKEAIGDSRCEGEWEDDERNSFGRSLDEASCGRNDMELVENGRVASEEELREILVKNPFERTMEFENPKTTNENRRAVLPSELLNDQTHGETREKLESHRRMAMEGLDLKRALNHPGNSLATRNNSTRIQIKQRIPDERGQYDEERLFEENQEGSGNLRLKMSKRANLEGRNYFPIWVLNEMYDSLLFADSLSFANLVKNEIYSRTLVSDNEFLSTEAALYWAQKRHLLASEMVESHFRKLQKNSKGKASTVGKVNKVGNKFSEIILSFGSQSKEKCLRSRFSIGDVVLLALEAPLQLNQKEDGQTEKNQKEMEIERDNLRSAQVTPVFPEIKIVGVIREIEKMGSFRLSLLPSSEQLKEIENPENTWRIQKTTNVSSFQESSDGLRLFCTKEMCSPTLMTIIMDSEAKESQLGDFASVSVGRKGIYHPNELLKVNRSQQIAVQMATSRTLTLIQGPPGTGKSSTGLEIVGEWVRRSSREPVLVCSRNTAEADSLHSILLEKGFCSLRIGAGSDDANDIASDEMFLSMQHQRRSIKEMSQVKFDIYRRKLRNAEVVCTTCIGAKSDILKSHCFTRVLIDDASQITEALSIIPLLRKCKQLVMLGDSKGVTPFSSLVLAQKQTSQVSLFERLMNKGVRPICLNVQYKMHSSLLMFPNFQFYSDEIIDGLKDEDRPPVHGFSWPNSKMRVACIDTNEPESISSDSLVNLS